MTQWPASFVSTHDFINFNLKWPKTPNDPMTNHFLLYSWFSYHHSKVTQKTKRPNDLPLSSQFMILSTLIWSDPKHPKTQWPITFFSTLDFFTINLKWPKTPNDPMTTLFLLYSWFSYHHSKVTQNTKQPNDQPLSSQLMILSTLTWSDPKHQMTRWPTIFFSTLDFLSINLKWPKRPNDPMTNDFLLNSWFYQL